MARYDARLEFSCLRQSLGPVMLRTFDRVGAAAEAGMQAALNP
jgi:hypothetical protein